MAESFPLDFKRGEPRIGSLGDVDAVYTKIGKRLIPFLTLLFVTAWLDRYNIGFAKLQMAKDLGFSEAVYGFGAGIVYLGYMLFEVPSNLLLQKIGARKTFARITILWGLTSIATMLVKTATGFYILRFLLGSFEAGLLPGVVLYLTYWFPARRRALMLGLFLISVPITGIFGNPLSGWIMGSMGQRMGLANWQWLFLLEGIPSIIVGLLALTVVVDKPGDAPWLSEEEKRLLRADLDEDFDNAGPREHSLSDGLRGGRVWLLAVTFFCLISTNVTLPFWMPTVIQDLGVKSTVSNGLLSAVPYVFGLLAIVLVGWHSDRTQERRYHSALPCLGCAISLVSVGIFAHTPVLAFLALISAQACASGAAPPFWQIPSMLLAGTAAAAGIALINSIGNLSGWLGPSVVGWLKDLTGTTSSGLYVVAGLEVVATLLILCFVPNHSTRNMGETSSTAS
jgi:D-galactonate transporter